MRAILRVIDSVRLKKQRPVRFQKGGIVNVRLEEVCADDRVEGAGPKGQLGCGALDAHAGRSAERLVRNVSENDAPFVQQTGILTDAACEIERQPAFQEVLVLD